MDQLSLVTFEPVFQLLQEVRSSTARSSGSYLGLSLLQAALLLPPEDQCVPPV